MPTKTEVTDWRGLDMVDSSGSKIGRIELIILRDGTVGSVKLLSLPNNVHEAMFLSAVKAWEFSPAIRNGRPVSYRKTVWVTFQ